jgi:Resolvase, N terminal domain
LARSGRTWVDVLRGAGPAASRVLRGPGNRRERALGDAPDQRRSSRLAPGCLLIGYVTVAPDGGPYDAERLDAAIEARCERFAWNLLEIVHDREQGRIRERPGLRSSLERIVKREGDGIVVGDLRGLSRSKRGAE